MIDLLVAGNLWFSLPVVFTGLAVLVVAARGVVGVTRGGPADAVEAAESERSALFHLGLFAFVFGLMSQAISLYQMMGAIEQAGAVSPAIVAGGLKVSFIVPTMGVIVFVVALLLRLGLGAYTSRRRTSDA